jgi:sugar/nucleoside kinase (ribokinase family)
VPQEGLLVAGLIKIQAKFFFTIDSFTKNPKDPVGAGDALTGIFNISSN